MASWLLKSEPDTFSWEQQVRNGVEPWTGVRSHEARRHLAAMAVDDRAFFYHSNAGREIVGTVVVTRTAYPDPTAGSGENWIAVDVRADRPLVRPVTLAAIRADPAFGDFALVRRARLSVLPVSAAEWDRILDMGGGLGPFPTTTVSRAGPRAGRKPDDHGHS